MHSSILPDAMPGTETNVFPVLVILFRVQNHTSHTYGVRIVSFQ